MPLTPSSQSYSLVFFFRDVLFHFYLKTSLKCNVRFSKMSPLASDTHSRFVWFWRGGKIDFYIQVTFLFEQHNPLDSDKLRNQINAVCPFQTQNLTCMLLQIFSCILICENSIQAYLLEPAVLMASLLPQTHISIRLGKLPKDLAEPLTRPHDKSFYYLSDKKVWLNSPVLDD